MKKNLLICLAVFSIASTLQAQTINVVPNPTAPDLFAWTGSGALSGYSGTPTILNNSLVLEYNPSGTSDPTQITQQLATYSGGNSLTLIPNPDAGQGVYLQSVQVIFDNKLFIIYLDASGIQRLASFDGTSITLYPNPDAGLGYIGSPRIFNNKLYVVYSNAAGVTQFGYFNGTGITLIPNPDNSTVGFYNDYAVVFDNKICSRYVTAAGPKQLAAFDGTSWTILPNPDNSTRGVYPAFPAQYHNKLYFTYYSATNQYQFMEYDGTNNPTLIANPENSSTNDGGVSGFPIVYNDTLFFQYYSTANVSQLAKFGGISISLVPNPDNTTYGFWNTPIVYNNNLYIFYLPANGIHHLTQYVGNGDSLHVIPNPDGGLGYWDQPIVYDKKLYFMYYNAQQLLQLGYFDGGNSLKLISNPSGFYNGAAGNNGYTGYPIIWNSKLYMQFGGVPYGDAGNLAYFDGSTLPLTLLNFAGSLQDNKITLQWQTANEVNTSDFVLERSANGYSFTSLATIKAAGESKVTQNYSYVDASPLQGVNYYRLKMVDGDGKFTYSKIVQLSVNGSSISVKVFPNPVTNTLNILLPFNASGTIDLKVANAAGNTVLHQTLQGNNSSISTGINVSELNAGAYYLTVTANGKTITTSFVKQ